MKLFATLAAAALVAAPAQAQHIWDSSQFSYGGSAPIAQAEPSECPYGTSPHQRKALFGLIKGRTMCLTDYEAENLRQQRFQAWQQLHQQNMQNINQNRSRICSTRLVGNYAYSSCY